jgi:hypothetical protein
MPLMNRIRRRLGDVVEVEVKKGFAYAHFTHAHKQYGSLVRVFGEIHVTRPAEFSRVVVQPVLFQTFFPLSAACSRKIVSLVASEAVCPPSEFPVFRAGIQNSLGIVDNWWLWDGETEKQIGRLEPGVERFPIRGVINDTLLVERISSGWRSENVT